MGLERTVSSKKLSRRMFVHGGSLFLAGFGTVLGESMVTQSVRGQDGQSTDRKPTSRLGLVTDMHYADKKASGSRHYRDSIDKLAVAREKLDLAQLDGVVELGDFIDAADSVDVELGYLRKINSEFKRLSQRTYYVLGNHCVHTLTKKEFLGAVGQNSSYFSFDMSGAHFIVLDACFRSDGVEYGRKNFDWTDPNISQSQLTFLEKDLSQTKAPTVVFVHQRLDVSNAYGIKNGKEVRAILENSGKVTAVFQGHSHENEHQEINGIHYCTLAAMVEGPGSENTAFSTLEVFSDGSLKVSGYAKQSSYEWKMKV
jgi:alkaline phosphatase